MSFIFQAVPDRYDLRTQLVPGFRVLWVASRYHQLMQRGDVVYFWLAGEREQRGLYGWGTITGDAPVLVQGQGYRIEVEYGSNFLYHRPPTHVSCLTFEQDPVLRNHLILRMPIGTNFVLNEVEDLAVRTAIASILGKEWLPPPSHEIFPGEEEEDENPGSGNPWTRWLEKD